MDSSAYHSKHVKYIFNTLFFVTENKTKFQQIEIQKFAYKIIKDIK